MSARKAVDNARRGRFGPCTDCGSKAVRLWQTAFGPQPVCERCGQERAAFRNALR